MTNDKEMEKQMKELKKEVQALDKAVDAWVTYIKSLGNQCAYTDRMLEGVIDIGVNKVGKLIKKISHLHDRNK